MFQHVSSGVDHPASDKLPVPADTLKLCPLCHEKMPGRPAEQRQIDIATHAGTQQCIRDFYVLRNGREIAAVAHPAWKTICQGSLLATTEG